MSTLENVTFGSDPEYAVVKNDKIVSGIGYVGGDKHKPLILNENLGITRTEDNVLFEAQIPPVTTKEEWLKMFKAIRDGGNVLLEPHDMKLLAMSSHHYDDDQLQHPMAQTFGCSPSINAWTEQAQFTCGPEEAGNLRSSGFHVHLGTTSNLSEEDVYNFIKCCDLFLGVPSVIIDLDTERRRLYGRAGECRFRVIKEYIVMEYRSLGGNILANDELIGWVFDNLSLAVEFYNNGNFDFLKDGDKIVEAINNCDEQLAIELCNKYNIYYPNIKVDKENFIYHNEKIYA